MSKVGKKQKKPSPFLVALNEQVGMLKRNTSNLCVQHEKIKKERDALAAAVERLRDAAKSFYNSTIGNPDVEVASIFDADVKLVNNFGKALRNALEETPVISLAEHDAEVARKAVIHGFSAAVALSRNKDIEPLGVDVYAERVASVYLKTLLEFAKNNAERAKRESV